MLVDRILKWAVLLDDIELKINDELLNSKEIDVALLFSFGTFDAPESPDNKFFILNRVFIEKNTNVMSPHPIIFRETENDSASYASLPTVDDLLFYISETLNNVRFANKSPHYHILRFNDDSFPKQDFFLKKWIKQTLSLSKK